MTHLQLPLRRYQQLLLRHHPGIPFYLSPGSLRNRFFVLFSTFSRVGLRELLCINTRRFDGGFPLFLFFLFSQSTTQFSLSVTQIPSCTVEMLNSPTHLPEHVLVLL